MDHFFRESGPNMETNGRRPPVEAGRKPNRKLAFIKIRKAGPSRPCP